MDTIEFRVEHRELGNGFQDCVEIMINGRDLGEWFAQLEGRPVEASYAGLAPELALVSNSRFLDDPTAPPDRGDPAHADVDDDLRRRTYVMRCTCGDHYCSYVLAKIRVEADRVTWSDFFGSHGAPPDAYGALGPFEFERDEYEAALIAPRPSG